MGLLVIETNGTETAMKNYEIEYTNGYGERRRQRPVAVYKDDGQLFYVVPAYHGHYSAAEPYTIIRKTADVRIIRQKRD